MSVRSFTVRALLGTAALLLAVCTVPEPVAAQSSDDHRITGGVLGGLNVNRFRVEDGVEEYDWANSWAAGLWIDFPYSDLVSFEAQVLYSSLKYEETDPVGTSLLSDATVGYLSVPLQLKLSVHDIVAFTVGPQFDFPVRMDDQNDVWSLDDLSSFQWGVHAGVEVAPFHRVSLFGRYIHGLENVDAGENPNTQSEYYNQTVQVGAKLRLFGGAATPTLDSDGDGIPDRTDACPAQPGPVRYGGCPAPDADGDGIADDVDVCPGVPGVAEFDGCPSPDSDGDGIVDADDRCPNEPGVTAYAGCPVPDSDGDGLNDEADRCPGTPGVPAMQGCPEIDSFEPHRVTFALNSAALTDAGRAELNEVIAYMRTHPDVDFRIEGHTDNTGSDRINNPLSRRRAESVRDYLVSQGLSAARMVTEGYGSTRPVATNESEAGRAFNRRVEIIVR